MVQLREVVGEAWNVAHTYMGAYGAETKKGTRLWSNRSCVHKLKKKLPEDCAKSKDLATVDERRKKLGLPCVTGVKGVLKGSQAYPKAYGQAVVKVYKEERLQIAVLADTLEEEHFREDWTPQHNDLWEDAWAQEIMTSIALPMDQLVVTAWPRS